MKQAHSALSSLAQLLLIHETEASQDKESLSDAMERAFDKLRLHLAKLMGLDGFTLLLVRALTFARADFPWLREVHTEKDGSLKNLRSTLREQEPAEATEGCAMVLSYFFGLLMTFIGEALTLRLIQGVWPEVDLGGKGLGQEEST